MIRNWKYSLTALAVSLGMAAAGAAQTSGGPPVPGTLNYIEGQAFIDGRQMAANGNRSVLEADHVLDTGQGKVEVLLTPGAFLRIGDHSEIRMISPGLADTRVELAKGSAMVEVSQLLKQNNLMIEVAGVTTRIDKKGLYEFHAAPPAAMVLSGEATVDEAGAHISLKKGHELALNNPQGLRPQKFDAVAAESGPLYRWSKLRSEYEAEANVDTGRYVMAYGGWYGPGWYWDPFWDFYAFLPGDGILFSPFGYGFYSPFFVYRAPYHSYGYRGPVMAARGGFGHGFTGGSRSQAFHGGRGFAMTTPHVAPSFGGGFHGGFSGSFHGGGRR